MGGGLHLYAKVLSYYKSCKYLGGISGIPQALYKLEYYIEVDYYIVFELFKLKTAGDIVRDVRDVREL